MGLASLMQTAAVLVKSAVKRSSIVPSATHDYDTVDSSTFAPPGPHLGRHNVMSLLRSMNNPG
jgi:hypothetical protein